MTFSFFFSFRFRFRFRFPFFSFLSCRRRSRFVFRPASATLGFASLCAVLHFFLLSFAFCVFVLFPLPCFCDSRNKETNRSLYTSSKSHLAFHNTPCTFDFGPCALDTKVGSEGGEDGETTKCGHRRKKMSKPLCAPR